MHPNQFLMYPQSNCSSLAEDPINKLLSEEMKKALNSEETKAKIVEAISEYFAGEKFKDKVKDTIQYHYTEAHKGIAYVVNTEIASYITSNKKQIVAEIHKVAKEVIKADKPFFVSLVREYFAGEIKKIAYIAVDKAVKARKNIKK